IDTDGACWNCHHCGWSGPEKGQQPARPVTETVSVTKPNPEPEPEPGPTPAPAGKTYYVYHTADGTPAFRKIRAYDKDGDKLFWIERPDGRGGWVRGTRDKDGNSLADLSLLYRLPEVIEAIANGHEIACVEGEKDADNLWAIRIPATCSAHG